MDDFDRMISDSGIDGESHLAAESIAQMVGLVADVYQEALRRGLPEDFAREVSISLLLEGMRNGRSR